MNMHLAELFLWLLRVSWQASVLALVILATQWVFQKQLNARWRYTLWFLLIARLALPILPSSPLSIFNLNTNQRFLVSTPPAVHQAQSMADRPSTYIPLPQEQDTSSTQRAAPVASQRVRLQTIPEKNLLQPSRSPRGNALQAMALIWLAGLFSLMVRIVVQNARFHRRLAAATPVTDAQVLSMFDTCRAQMGIKSKTRLVESSSVNSPALHGLLRRTLLLPPGMINQFTEVQLRHIFLHELAHIKRNDMAVLAVVTLCKIVHWFNPFLWLAFRRMSADRELACDELALSNAGERQNGPYGETILKLLEVCDRPAIMAGAIGILEEKQQMRRRILMIANFGQRRSSLSGIILVIAVGLVTLTNAQTGQSGPTPAASDGSPANNSPEFGKAQAEYQSAMAAYQQDQELARKDRQRAAAAVFHLGEAYRQQGQSEKANEQFQRILDEFPDVDEFSSKSQQYLLGLPDPPPNFLFSITNVLYPGGVAVDSAGNIYVSDTHRNRIDKFTSQGEPVTNWGQQGDEEGNFNYPQGLAIDAADNLYVADVQNHRVQKFAANGTFLKAWGGLGSSAGQFNQPYNIAVDKSGNVYVVDNQNNRVQEFTSDGVYIRTISGGLHNPQGVAVDSSGNIYVGDRQSGDVEKFLPNGTIQPGFNWAGAHDVAVDASGNIYLANADQSCAQEYSPTGILLTQWGRQGTAPGQFNFIARITIDNVQNRVLITDAQNNRVQVFGYSPVAESK